MIYAVHSALHQRKNTLHTHSMQRFFSLNRTIDYALCKKVFYAKLCHHLFLFIFFFILHFAYYFFISFICYLYSKFFLFSTEMKGKEHEQIADQMPFKAIALPL